MEDIFKNLPSLCDPSPIVSIRGNQGGKKDAKIMRQSATRSGSEAGLVSAQLAARSLLVLIGRTGRAVTLSWQRIKEVNA